MALPVEYALKLSFGPARMFGSHLAHVRTEVKCIVDTVHRELKVQDFRQERGQRRATRSSIPIGTPFGMARIGSLAQDADGRNDYGDDSCTFDG